MDQPADAIFHPRRVAHRSSPEQPVGHFLNPSSGSMMTESHMRKFDNLKN